MDASKLKILALLATAANRSMAVTSLSRARPERMETMSSSGSLSIGTPCDLSIGENSRGRGQDSRRDASVVVGTAWRETGVLCSAKDGFTTLVCDDELLSPLR